MSETSVIAAVKSWRWTSLLFMLLAAMFLSAASDSSAYNDVITITAFALVFAGTLRAAILSPFLKNSGLGLVALWLVLGIIAVFDISRGVGSAFMLVTFCILLGCLMVTISELARNKEAGLDPVMGAVFGYILIAVIWALLYVQIENDIPGSFNTPSDQKTSSEFIYFSLVTLTSLGYGDITPTAPIPRLLAGLQAATGTIYIAVFIGRVVARFKD